MSERNYQRMRQLGITGRNKSNCFIASCDRISPEVSVSRQCYETYDHWVEKIEPSLALTQRRHGLAMLFTIIAREFGLNSYKDIVFERVETARQLTLLLRREFILGRHIIIDIDASDHELKEKPQKGEGLHCAGVIPLSVNHESFVLRSTWLPGELLGVLTPEDLFDHIAVHDDPHMPHFPFHDANVSIFPIY